MSSHPVEITVAAKRELLHFVFRLEETILRVAADARPVDPSGEPTIIQVEDIVRLTEAIEQKITNITRDFKPSIDKAA